MKLKVNSINALCVLVIGFLLVSILLPGSIVLISYADALINPDVTTTTSPEAPMAPVDVTFSPSATELFAPSNSLSFNDGLDLPFVIHRGIVMVPDDMVQPHLILNIVIYALILACFIALLVDFIKFIVNINRGKIFEPRNIRYLSRFGLLLIGIGLLDCLEGLTEQYFFSQIGLTLQGYELSSQWEIPWSTFLLGFLALLLARVWSEGMSIKEELRLTI